MAAGGKGLLLGRCASFRVTYEADESQELDQRIALELSGARLCFHGACLAGGTQVGCTDGHKDHCREALFEKRSLSAWAELVDSATTEANTPLLAFLLCTSANSLSGLWWCERSDSPAVERVLTHAGPRAPSLSPGSRLPELLVLLSFYFLNFIYFYCWHHHRCLHFPPLPTSMQPEHTPFPPSSPTIVCVYGLTHVCSLIPLPSFIRSLPSPTL